jgi:hypothetical protein
MAEKKMAEKKMQIILSRAQSILHFIGEENGRE